MPESASPTGSAPAKIQFASRAEIEAHQLQELRTLVAELFPGNAFYAGKYNSVGVTFDVAGLEDFRRRFPFSTKAEIVGNQLAHPPYGTNLTYPLERYTRFHQTSGTTGTPLRWLDTAESWDWMVETWREVLEVAEVQSGHRVYFAFSFGPFIGFWLAFEAAGRIGCLCIPGGGLSSAARLRAIVDNRVDILCCTPTYALRLAEVAQQEQVSLAKTTVRTIIVAGEPGGSVPAVRQRISDAWHGARVFDHHGMTETGPVTYECPARPGTLHVREAAYLAEIVDPATGKARRPGEAGELVLTTLGRLGSPLLRYKTGDLVKAASPSTVCACGRHELALEGGILGRTDDMVVVRGVNVYPSAVEELVRSASDIAEYQVQISSSGAMTEMTLQIEPTPQCQDAGKLVARLEAAFEAALSLRVPITAVATGALPRFEMKGKRWVRKDGAG